MDIVELPRDLFLLVVAHLSARTIVLCRRVSRSWHGAFADPDLNLQLMKWHFPRCREMRVAYLAGALGGCVPAGSEGVGITADEQGRGRRDENEASGDGAKASWSPDWTVTFANVARRYHHLRTATSWTVEAIKLGSTEHGPSRMFYPVAIWDRFLRLDDKTAPFHYPDPAWSYSQDDGLLVYHSAVLEDTAGVDEPAASCPWRLRDLETGKEVVVPFPQGEDRIVRRVRLCDRVLVLEWCEREAYHQLNDREECHRHFVTALDIVRERGTHSGRGDSLGDHNTTNETWAVRHRCQFKTHFLGFPLNRHDRFFSAHTATHYAVYVWQPNRSLYNDDPIESVIIWDISARGQPQTIRRITWDTLAFYGVRQGSTPTLRSLGMDERNLYFLEEEHRWAEGGHSSLVPPRVHLVRSTGIPIVVPEVEATGTSSAGHAAGGDGAEVVIQGPRWVDQCGTNTDVSMPFCTRSNETRFGGMREQQHTALVAGGGGGEWPTSSATTWDSNGTVAAVPSPAGRISSRGKGLAGEIEAGIAAGTSRWPGWAPCWRHEDFPYLSVGEVVDFRAGVRVTARHCFMLETLSVHVRPSISVVELGVGGDDEFGQDEGDSSSDGGGADASAVARMARLERKLRAGMARRKLQKRRVRVGGGGGEAVDGERNDDGESAHEEVQFADDMWERLLGKGCISGDERWLIGEDGKGTLSVVRF